MGDLKKLIEEYKKSLNILHESKKKIPYHQSAMSTDTEWAIEYMETGYIPRARHSTSRWSKDKRDVPIDPQNMARFVRFKKSAPAPEWMTVLLDDILCILTPRERDAYELVRGNSFTFSEAAKFLGVTKGTIQNLVRRAEGKIKLKIGEQASYRLKTG